MAKSFLVAVFVVLVSFLNSGLAVADQHVGPALTKDLVSFGKVIYRKNCADCHGANLEGQPNWKERSDTGVLPAPPHDESGHTWHHPDSLLFQITKLGGQASMPEGMTSGMPGFEDTLSDAKIWAVLSYIKSTWPTPIQARHKAMSEK